MSPSILMHKMWIAFLQVAAIEIGSVHLWIHRISQIMHSLDAVLHKPSTELYTVQQRRVALSRGARHRIRRTRAGCVGHATPLAGPLPRSPTSPCHTLLTVIEAPRAGPKAGGPVLQDCGTGHRSADGAARPASGARAGQARMAG